MTAIKSCAERFEEIEDRLTHLESVYRSIVKTVTPPDSVANPMTYTELNKAHATVTTQLAIARDNLKHALEEGDRSRRYANEWRGKCEQSRQDVTELKRRINEARESLEDG